MKMKKSIALAISLILVLTVTVGGTLAFLIAESPEVKNIFNPSKVTTTVDETFENNVKRNVSIQNTGDTEAYIRAAVVVTWQKEVKDSEGNVISYEVYGTAPVAGTDYTISYKTEQQSDPVGTWTLGSDGFYYWSKPVPAGAKTGILISEAKLAENAAVPDGYFLCIEIIGSGIQSKPTSVVAGNWGVAVADDGTISK